jgi:hypothetical protein
MSEVSAATRTAWPSLRPMVVRQPAAAFLVLAHGIISGLVLVPLALRQRGWEA